MKYFIDTEFYEAHMTIYPISIAIVAEDGRELYLEAPTPKILDDWIMKNVMPVLGSTKFSYEEIRDYIVGFINADKPEFWGYYCAYDWVVICQLFGRMLDIPKHWPKHCLDIKQWCVSLGNPKLPQQEFMPQHHALSDAKQVRAWWKWLSIYERIHHELPK